MTIIMKEDIPFLKIGVGISIFVGGGLATYAALRLANNAVQHANQERIEQLTDQIAALKKEIEDLNSKLPRAVEDVKLELSNLRSLICERRSKKSTSNLSICSFETAWSEDEFEGDHNCDERLGTRSPIDSEGLLHGNAISNEEKKRALYAKIDSLNAGTSEEKEAAMRILQDNEINYKDDWEFLWRLARSHIGLYELRKLMEERRAHASAGHEYAKRAIEIYEPSTDVHKWYAISLGTMTDFVSTKEKIQNGYQLKEHVQRALELNPSDPTLYFMMGRWCWGVYMLSWIERKLATTLFATPPTSTVQDALDAFVKAEEISPGFYKANQLYIGKCYYEMSQYSDAKKWLESAKEIDMASADDEATHEEVLQLLSKL